LKTTVLVLAVFVLVVAAVLASAEWRWRSRTRAIAAALRQGTPPAAPALYSPEQLVGLPAPVQRYFQAVLREGQPLVRHVRLRQSGQFLVKPAANRWGPFTATQDFRVRPAAFVWDARISMGPGIAARVRDSFVDGQGSMYGAAMALFTVARMENTPDLAIGELMRYIGEACWFPTALLPSAGVIWAAADDSTARATLTVSGVSASVDFHFGTDSLVWGVSSLRPRAVGSGSVPTLWRARWLEYGVRSGVRIPVQGEVEWLLPDGPQPYWRARITEIVTD
jgi:hypothetical protein